MSMRQDRQVPLPVSIQVCTLNEEANIRDCLVSIQANDPEEIVVIDGGSTDRTVEIASTMGVRVLRPGRLGLGPSRQLGWTSTDSHYVGVVDADDRLPEGWLAQMLSELEHGTYAALQSCIRALPRGNWWASGWNQYFIESVKPCASTSIVGRPALYVADALRRIDEEVPSLDEDTFISRILELKGMRQGIGQAVAHRYVERTYTCNARKWRSYGYGYRNFVHRYPERRGAILGHVLFTIPFRRTIPPLLRGHLSQPIFGLIMSMEIIRGWLLGGAAPE